MSNSGNEESTTSAKGVVLDLHANPEASGSRFEDPMWWKYLPSLKPIGLNALLTYESMMTSKHVANNEMTSISSEVGSNNALSPDNQIGISCKTLNYENLRKL